MVIKSTNAHKRRKLSYIINTVTLLHENCAPLGHHAASSGNFAPTFRDNLSATS